MLDNRNEKLIEPMDNRIEELMNASNKSKKNKELGTENRTHSLFLPLSQKRKIFRLSSKKSKNTSLAITLF